VDSGIRGYGRKDAADVRDDGAGDSAGVAVVRGEDDGERDDDIYIRIYRDGIGDEL
jgi:hypothetical protein